MSNLQVNLNSKDDVNISKEVCIFLAGFNFWEGLFDNLNVKFIRNLLSLKIPHLRYILMTIILPHHLSREKSAILKEKKELLKKIAFEHGTVIEFCHIRNRTLTGLFSAFKEIRKKTFFYQKRFIWASNYFNCFLGILIKVSLPYTYLHFEMMGLASEEELLYSETNILSRISKYMILKIFCKINLKKADSVSVVSKRFKEYLISRYRLNPSMIEVIPCYYDDKVFYFDDNLRKKFRLKYQIQNSQKLLLYSGMLQRWQDPDLLFKFFKNLKQQDKNREFRLMVISFDQKKAHYYATKYGINDLLIDTAIGRDLNGVYNAADIGIATRTEDWVSKVSSPAKIPEYLATLNSIILLESIGDYGLELKRKKYALVKEKKEDLLNTDLSEIRSLKIPDHKDRVDIFKNYCAQKSLPIIKKIFLSSLIAEKGDVIR
jgi:glycosyltransferase involved in cell wall biosynthesis